MQTYDVDNTITLATKYHALSSDAWDAADLQPGSPHQSTYLSAATDGHGRTIEVTERFKEGTAIERRITRTQYLPSGEPEVIRREKGSTGEKVTRWFVYDTMGRLVLNVEPNTSPGYALNANPNTGLDNTVYDAIAAWRYRYNDAGDVVGTSDARGCGANFFYDGVGRLVGEDYFPCAPHHAAYASPDVVDISVPASGDPALDAFFTSTDRLPAEPTTGIANPMRLRSVLGFAFQVRSTLLQM